jgi:tetratricopeptide (TPR) repeat protein
MMKNAGFVVALFWSIIAFAQPGPGNRAEISIPGVPGILQLDVGATTFQTAVTPDGKEVQLRAFDRPDHLGISAFLQRVTFPASAEKCRDEWWPATKKSAPMKRDDLNESLVTDGIARVEYIVPEYRGNKIHQKTIHAYLGSGNLCAEVHLSKAGFEPNDQKLFEQVLSSVKLLPDQSPSGATGQSAPALPADDSLRYLGEGSRSYLQRDYSSAARSYQKALNLEKQKRTLPRDTFRVLVDNLGMSYGISGKLQQAKETFEYGLAQDSEYPMFHYDLACTYGEMKNMPQAIEELRLAYKYKANMIAGETLPDPIQDDSFRYFVRDDSFVRAVTEMKK